MSLKKDKNLPLFLTLSQAAAVSGIGVNKLRQLADDGELDYIPIGNRKLVTLDGLMAWYESNKVCAKHKES